MANTYKFNRVRPPLMKDFNGDIYSVSNESLRDVIGTEKWTTQKSVGKKIFHFKGEVIETHFVLTRLMYWALLVHPEHFAEDLTKTVTTITGFSETQKHTMERGLEAKAGASGFGLSAEIKASLKITDETTREWHTERKEEFQQSFKADCTYCSWNLIDELILDKTEQRKMKGKPSPMDPRIISSHCEFNCVLGTYQDKWEETGGREITLEEWERQAGLEKHMPTVIALPTGKL